MKRLTYGSRILSKLYTWLQKPNSGQDATIFLACENIRFSKSGEKRMCSQATIFCGCRVSVYKQCWKTIRAKAMLRIPFLSGTVNSLKTLARLLRLMNSTECRRCQPPSLETPVYDFFIITKETLFLRRRNRNAIDAKLTFFCFGSRDVSQSECFFTPGSGSGIWWEGS